MAKNYATIYASPNDSIALEQKVFIKEEPTVTRGQLEVPLAADFIYTLNGASVNFSQPIESSPHKSGRHHTSIIKQRTVTEWTVPTFFNIDTTEVAASLVEIDPGMRVLWKSLMGKEDVTGGSPVYTSETPPSITFSIFENGDLWAKQAPGCFVEAGNASFPGDGQSQVEWSGMAKTALLVGIGNSTTDNSGGNDFTLASGEGARFPVGALVMILDADGVTRLESTDTAPRNVTVVTGDVITLDGAAIVGTGTDTYLAYYEPESPVAINDPQTGLSGSITIVGLGSADCVRSATMNMVNNHEVQDFCFGEEGLGGRLFTPGGRFTAELSLELNLNHDLVEFLNGLKEFTGEDITIILGDATGRHVQLEVPKSFFPIPEIAVPDTGTIPVTFTGNAYQTALDAADEVTVSFL